MTACRRACAEVPIGDAAMGMLDKVTERLQGLMGKGKPGNGKSDGKGDGKADEVKAAVKDAGEAVKDAAVHIKDVLKGD